MLAQIACHRGAAQTSELEAAVLSLCWLGAVPWHQG